MENKYTSEIIIDNFLLPKVFGSFDVYLFSIKNMPYPNRIGQKTNN